ncbi:hypothetical protein NST99_05250 [Paenibacillus sp. FSL L8-0470]|uniref:hypothetical protein n=1 Tax=unclassified Paenibacillus TaxID=185978 RepID=UPI0030F7385E
MNKKWSLLILVVLTSALLLTGCEKRLMFVGSSSGKQIKASYKLLSGTETKTLKLKEGETLLLDYTSKVDKGKLSMKLYDPDHELVKELRTNEAGEEQVEIKKDGKYKLEIVGTGTKGSYKIKYSTEAE